MGICVASVRLWWSDVSLELADGDGGVFSLECDGSVFGLGDADSAMEPRTAVIRESLFNIRVRFGDLPLYFIAFMLIASNGSV